MVVTYSLCTSLAVLVFRRGGKIRPAPAATASCLHSMHFHLQSKQRVFRVTGTPLGYRASPPNCTLFSIPLLWPPEVRPALRAFHKQHPLTILKHTIPSLLYEPPLLTTVSMAVKERYTLQDIEEYARGNFEAAFQVIADPGLYNFESRQFRTDDGHLIEAELVDFAFWAGPFFGIPVLAYSDGIDTIYFYGRLGTDLKACAPPISSGGKKLSIQDLKVPFSYAAARTEPRSSASNASEQREHVRKLARERLALLVKFVFLLTGRVTSLERKRRRHVASIQGSVPSRATKENRRNASMASRSQDARRTSTSTSTSVDLNVTDIDTADAGTSQIISSEHSRSGSIVIRSSKRAASDDSEFFTDAGSSSTSYSKVLLHNH